MSRSRAVALQKQRSTPRGGYVVHSRVADGYLRGASLPIEHASLSDALTEAHRLAGVHGREFVVFAEVSAVAAPVEAPAEPCEPQNAAPVLEQAAA